MNMKKCVLVSLLVLGGDVLAAPVNINSADAHTIAAALAGIGEKKAEAIVQYRQAHGPYKSVDELVNVSGIGGKLLDKIKVDVLLNAPGGAVDAGQPALPGTPQEPAKK